MAGIALRDREAEGQGGSEIDQRRVREARGGAQGDHKLLEAQRLQQRTDYDLEMLETMGFCNGIENYSRHLDGPQAG